LTFSKKPIRFMATAPFNLSRRQPTIVQSTAEEICRNRANFQALDTREVMGEVCP
jgi:hypothetical protein